MLIMDAAKYFIHLLNDQWITAVATTTLHLKLRATSRTRRLEYFELYASLMQYDRINIVVMNIYTG